MNLFYLLKGCLEMNVFDIDVDIVDYYDRIETMDEDYTWLINNLPKRNANILELFCGSGRILLPLIKDGHKVHGIDNSTNMLGKLRSNLNNLPDEISEKATFENADVLEFDPKEKYEVVILGGNCLYGFGDSQTQFKIIESAVNSMSKDSLLFIDCDNHYEIPSYWGLPGEQTDAFPTFDVSPQKKVCSSIKITDVDQLTRTWSASKSVKVFEDDKVKSSYEFDVKTHVVSYMDVLEWTDKLGLELIDSPNGIDKSLLSNKELKRITGLFKLK